MGQLLLPLPRQEAFPPARWLDRPTAVVASRQRWRNTAWKAYPTRRLREAFKLVGLVSLIPSLQIAQARSSKLDAGKLHVQFERRTEASARAIERASSDPTAVKRANDIGRPAEEFVEPRAGAKENAGEGGTLRTPSREGASHGLNRVRRASPSIIQGGSRMP